MNIAIIGTRGIPARYGGFETCAEEISQGLARKGHTVTVYCRFNNSPGNPSYYKKVKLIYVAHVDSKNIGTLTHAFFAFIHAIFQRFDTLIVFNVGLAPLCIIPRLFHQKVVLNVDGLEWKRKKWGFFAKHYFLFCEKISGFIVDKVITDSKTIQNYYKHQYGLSSSFIPYGAHARGKLNLKVLDYYGLKKGDYFLIASRLEPENNADLIIQEFLKVKTDKKLVIAGGANYKSEFVEKLKKIKDKRIRLLGPVYTQGHVENLHLGCFAYIHGNEVGGTNPALLKAMGYGNCILALDVAYNREVVRNGAILFNRSNNNLRDKIKEMMTNPNKRKKYQQEARIIIKNFYTWGKIVDSYESLLRTISRG